MTHKMRPHHLLQLIGYALFQLVSTPALSEIPCTLSCGSTPSCSTSLGEKPSKDSRIIKLSNCEDTTRLAVTRMVVWYPKKNVLTGKVVPEQRNIGEMTSDGDRSCSGLQCLFRTNRAKIPGGNPMGITSDEDSAQSSGAKEGLPFDEVLVPREGLSVKSPRDSKKEGILILTDFQGSREYARFPITDGRVVIPSSLLQGGERYGYRWQTNGAAVEGTFSVAREATVERVERAVAKRIQDLGLSGVEESLARVAALTAAGLRWNAKVLYENNSGE